MRHQRVPIQLLGHGSLHQILTEHRDWILYLSTYVTSTLCHTDVSTLGRVIDEVKIGVNNNDTKTNNKTSGCKTKTNTRE